MKTPHNLLTLNKYGFKAENQSQQLYHNDVKKELVAIRKFDQNATIHIHLANWVTRSTILNLLNYIPQW